MVLTWAMLSFPGSFSRVACCQSESRKVFMCIFSSAEQFLHRQARPSVSLVDGSESLMYKLAFSSLLLLLSFSLLSSRYHCLRLEWGTSTHVLQSPICSGRSNPRPRNSHSLSVFPVLHVTFETIRSLYTNKRRQVERLGKCRQHLLFVRLSPPAPSLLIVNSTQQ